MQTELVQALLALVAILLAARTLGTMAVRVGQPRVGGEMLAGLLVGAALLSPWRRVATSPHDISVLTGSTVRLLQGLGGIGVYLYMCLIGLTVSPRVVRRNASTIALISGATIAAAIVLAPVAVDAFGGARWRLARGTLTPTLIVAAALMVNGIPIVARVLQERDLLGGDLGATVLAASALLVTLPFLILVAVEHRFWSVGSDVEYVLWWAAAMAAATGLIAIWPRVSRPFARVALRDRTVLTLAVIGVLIGAWLSTRMLTTGLIGGFAVGVTLSRSRRARDVLERYLGQVVPTVLVPVYFAGAGARIAPRALDAHVLGGAALFTVLLVAVAALAGAATSRAPGIDRGEARTITALVNNRGLMLIALAVSMADDRLIGTALVMVFFLGALATTLMTGPLLRWADRAARPQPAERA